MGNWWYPRGDMVDAHAQSGSDGSDASPASADLPFEGIAPQERARLLGRYGRRVTAGTIVFHEGAPATEAFLLQQGRVRLVKRVGVTDRSLALLKAGDLFGEGALSQAATRGGRAGYSSTAAALTEAVMLVLDRETFRGLLGQYPVIAAHVIEQLVRRVGDAEDQIEIMMLRGVQSKVTTAILKLARAGGAGAQLIGSGSGGAAATAVTISPVELSTRVGLDVEAVKVAVQRLRDRNYVRITGERIEIPDIEALGQLQILLGTKDELAGTGGEGGGSPPPA
jgi:CRP/FNR family cyclic AMP-dependent transcriptional regulator